MSSSNFTTPVNYGSRFTSSVQRTNPPKRDSLAAELERDPELSTAKRKQRTQAFTSHMAHASLERQLAASQSAKAELESKLKEKDVLIERLESDRRWLAEREKEEREEKERERKEREEEKRKADSDIRALRNSFLALREQHNDLEDEKSSLARSTSQAIATQKSEISTLTHQVALLQNELAEFRHLAEQRGEAVQELQAQLDDMHAAQDSITQSASDAENWTVVREELHRQANHLRAVEAANAKMTSELGILRQRHTSVEVLKEQKRELERKVRGVEDLREKVVRLEAELQAGRKEREEWASKASGPSETPVSVTQSLSQLRLTYARLLEEHGSNVALMRQRETELLDAERREKESQQVATALQADLEALKDKLSRNEQKAALAEREIGFLQAMVASYTAEEASQDETKVDEITTQRVQQLETLVSEYKSVIIKLEREVEDLGGNPAALGDRRPRQELQQELESERASKIEAQKALREAETATEQHLEQIENLEQTLFELRGEIGAGRHLPPGVRVLSLRDNPAQQWTDLSQAAMDRLKGENEALLKRLRELEESGARAGPSSTEDLVPRESWESVNKEKKDLEEALRQKEKRLTRLKQVFSAKTDEFKEAIASILGVKLAFYPNGQVRVTSQFDLNAAFVFQPTTGTNEGMRMQLVAQGEGGPEDIPQLMRYWVEQEQCIPGFLASVTLACYETNKMSREQNQQMGHIG